MMSSYSRHAFLQRVPRMIRTSSLPQAISKNISSPPSWMLALPMMAAVLFSITIPPPTTSMDSQKQANNNVQNQLRTKSFPLVQHNHGKEKVRVLKVNRSDNKHIIYEYTVSTKIFFDGYSKVFTEHDNSDLVATDTQRNIVYVVAKRTKANSPEQFAMDICSHILQHYPMLQAVEVHADQVLWDRAMEGEHPHAFLKNSPEKASAKVRLERGGQKPQVTSSIKKMTVLKTTMSGFEDYLMDEYTLLPPTQERCLATELEATWSYTYDTRDFNVIRNKIRNLLILGLFGPPDQGVYSVSLQATVYDAACLVLKKCSQVDSIAISTPNKHYIPFHQLSRLGEVFEDDVFVPTDEPSGTIYCKVARNVEEAKKDTV